MQKFLSTITDWVSTKRGAWITLIIWFVVMIGLSLGPSLNDYKTTNFQFLPDEAQSIIAENKLEELFPNDQGTPGILVFHHENGEVNRAEVQKILDGIVSAKIQGIESIVQIKDLPPPAMKEFMSKDKSTLIIPMTLKKGLGNQEYGEINDQASAVGNKIAKTTETKFYITGPAGIAGDTVKLFERADFILLLSTIGIILVLLIVIYRSPLLAIIPLVATAIVYQVTNQSIALMGAAGLAITNSTASIMSILLFAAVIDYSLFVFSRYREELNHFEDRFHAMKQAMRATGEPVFFAGGTVLAAMLVLFFADFRDYSNFAPVFGLAIFIIMIASITLVPALFALIGRKAFWPRIPKVGKETEVKHGIWGPIAKFVVNKPVISGGMVAILMLIASINVFNLSFEFNAVKSFPEDLPSRIGYEIVEEKYDKGALAPSTLLVTSDQVITEKSIRKLTDQLASYQEIASVNMMGQTKDQKAVKYSVSLTSDPYSVEALNFIEKLQSQGKQLVKKADLSGEFYLAGVTAKLVDERKFNNQDIVKIVILETLLILGLLFFLTRSWKMPFYMMATILLSYVAALGLGLFLIDVLFGYEAVSTRVPVYAFIFLVALGIDYNIILVSRFIEERKKHPLKDALEIALRNTGGVISSAGVILAATFATLTTMPIADLFVFGFMVAIGILIDTFLIRGMLLPALILFFEKDKKTPVQSS